MTEASGKSTPGGEPISLRRVPVGVVARVLDLTERRVQQLVSEGHLPREERGEYDLPSVLEAWARYQRMAAARAGSANDHEEARARRTQAQARTLELELALESGVLVETDVAMQRLEAALTAFRHSWLNVINRAAPLLVGADTEEDAAGMLEPYVEEAIDAMWGAWRRWEEE